MAKLIVEYPHYRDINHKGKVISIAYRFLSRDVIEYVYNDEVCICKL